ncbi:hypothetical protein [Numidum massiliense]|uniref:hypothetical protein n=1 Tax=Numidum massiliense TaxID=1522315 RepID=UPI0006D58157|nr:hypothetical protein [Numidum massiliense]
MTKITVVDSIMGSGKTSWAIQYMQEAMQLEKFIYVTPFLSEVERIREHVANRSFTEPNNANEDGSKMTSLKGLIVRGENIATTHSLFQTADDELIELLTDSGYTLILDEVMDCVEPVNVRPSDIRKLENSGDIRIVDNRVDWVGDPHDDSRYKDIRLLAQAGNLFYYRGKFLVWAFPPRVFRAINKVIVMTYLFRGQMQRYYFDLFKFDYEYKGVKRGDNGRYELTDYDESREQRAEVMGLIDLYEGKLNEVGERKNALSSTWLRKADGETYVRINKNLYNYFRNVAKAKRSDVYYSTLKEVEPHIAPRGFKEPKRKNDTGKRQIVIPLNMRATNDYADRWAIAYVFNRYANPNINSFFQDNGVRIDEELLAVSDLLQWVWRSRIRKGEPIKLYLPSRRMRELLQAWAKYEI